MKLTVIGCGDAFGSGGRHHSCYLLHTSPGRLAIDCGATAPHALKGAGITSGSCDAVFVSHCHGDHFGGIPFLYLEKRFLERSTGPFEILGPPGIGKRVTDLMECLYPGLLADGSPFELQFRELTPGSVTMWRGLEIAAYEVEHFSGAPSLAITVEDAGRRFAFSGDSGWCSGVIAAGRDAHLYLIECTGYAAKTAMHLDYLTLASKFADIGAERYLLTHMSEEMLAAGDRIDRSLCELAYEGLVTPV